MAAASNGVECKICNRIISTKSHLKRHINDKHETTRVFHCKEKGCAYKSTQRGNLKLHTRTHFRNRQRQSAEGDTVIKENKAVAEESAVAEEDTTDKDDTAGKDDTADKDDAVGGDDTSAKEEPTS
ncbi:hypothetical protein BOTBODRAFT_35756 [Botryobasidium botryosum FD-172 SS1]|uniref:C2H2-type domain-containing protein n=1 Tax=Botryobasidium botryosum (strain FD-172 SS1) TaxID=930990 RepID=A0A067M8F8_BOTB1|nr:hypothetical protein BOTBODRAFT_35756 [Botryobasidium botryosum FD-172 SS1]